MKRPPSTFAVSLTPFREDGDLDESALRAHLRRLAAAGIGIYLGGSGSGEGHVLSHDERGQLFAWARDEVRGKVPLRAMGVEPRSATEAIELGRQVDESGLDAMQLYSLDLGHGYRPRPEEIETYLRDALEGISCAVVLSSHQAMGYALDPGLVTRLLTDYPQIIGINFTNADPEARRLMLEAIDGRIELHVGGPMQALAALDEGAHGYLSSEGNLAPRLCVRVIESHQQGDLAARDAAHATVMTLFGETQRQGGMSATKGALGRLGLAGGWPRRPRLPVAEAAARSLSDCFERLGLVESEEIAAYRSGSPA